MFFEGSEKKLEITVKNGTPSLRLLGKTFWQQVVASANAEILSSISNEECDAYLLSESSLFVWDDSFLMLTCGTTTLADAAIFFIDHMTVEAIEFAFYQRKNEYLSHLQTSSFEFDLIRLRERLSGEAYRIGHLDSHHCYIFCTNQPCPRINEDNIQELLMYHIQGEAAEYLRSSSQTAQGVREILQLEQLFPEFSFDDFLFDPFGYSINGIYADKYMTIHITPQKTSSYVSFETNLDLNTYSHPVLAQLLDILKPGCWDVIGFNSQHLPQNYPEHYRVGSANLQLEQGYIVDFTHYQQVRHDVHIPEKV